MRDVRAGRPGSSVCGQPRAREVAVEQRAVGVAELRAEAHEAAAVGGLRRKRARREVVDARAHAGSGRARRGAIERAGPGTQRPHVDPRARRGAGNGVAEVVVVPDLVADGVERPARPARTAASTRSPGDR